MFYRYIKKLSYFLCAIIFLIAITCDIKYFDTDKLNPTINNKDVYERNVSNISVLKKELNENLGRINAVNTQTSSADLSNEKVYVCGMPIGIYLQTNGILITKTMSVKSKDGLNYERVLDKLQSGDYILKVNKQNISSKQELKKYINESNGHKMTLTIRRNNRIFDISISPIIDENNEYKLGIWVRDDTQGIGTMTFIRKNGEFVALGHSITDIDTKKTLSSSNGILYKVDIFDIKKGTSSNTGGFCGSIDYQKKSELGLITSNKANGIKGILTDNGIDYLNSIYSFKSYNVASIDEIKTGYAQIISYINGKCKLYDIKITEIDKTSKDKGLSIEVIDKELLEYSGGIIPGMSGSPIIQNNKLIGAITHVLVGYPNKGYGIIVEKMFE